MKLDKIHFSNLLLWLILAAFFVIPTQIVYAQDSDEEGEMFWGDDEEEYEDDEEEYEDDEEEYEDDEEEYEDDFSSDDVDLADQAENMGWSIDISGSSPRFVNEALMTWNSSVNLRASIEAPFLMQVMGMRFRFGAELGTYGFEDSMPPKIAKLKGITAMGITSFPIGPGKIKLGIGIIGASVGSMFESSYGFKFGSLSLRVGIRYAKVLTPGSDIKESFIVEPENLNWMDGLVAVGISL